MSVRDELLARPVTQLICGHFGLDNEYLGRGHRLHTVLGA